MPSRVVVARSQPVRDKAAGIGTEQTAYSDDEAGQQTDPLDRHFMDSNEEDRQEAAEAVCHKGM